MRNFVNKVIINTAGKVNRILGKTSTAIMNKKGEGFVDTAVKILMSVVIGALVLSGLYMLFKDNILFCSRYNHDRDCYA